MIWEVNGDEKAPLLLICVDGFILEWLRPGMRSVEDGVMMIGGKGRAGFEWDET